MFLSAFVLYSPVSAHASVVATGVSDVGWGEQGTSYTHYDGDRMWAFYYDGSNIVYKSSVDGLSWSGAASTGSGAMPASFSVYGENDTIIVVYVNNAGDRWVVSKKGTINGSTISWGSEVQMENIPDSGNGPYNRGNFEKVNGTVYYMTIVNDDCLSDLYLFSTTDLGSTWSPGVDFLCSGANSVLWYPIIVRYADTKMLLAYVHWSSSEWSYRTFNGSSWSGELTSSGSSLPGSTHKDYNFAKAYDWNSQCALIAYIKSSGSSDVRVWKFCDGSNSFSTVESTTTNLYATMTERQGDSDSINLMYSRGSVIKQRVYNVTTGSWGDESESFGGGVSASIIKAETPNHMGVDNHTQSGVLFMSGTTLNFGVFGYLQTSICINETGLCYNTIQAAINNATSYQTVVITDDSVQYNENVTVNVTGLTLTSNTSTRPIVWANSSQVPVNITSGNVTVRNIQVIYNGTGGSFGSINAFVSGTNVTIFNNTVNNTGSGSSGYGIYLKSTTYGNVSSNDIGTSGGANNYGIYFTTSSSYSTVSRNRIWTDGTSDNHGVASSTGTGLYIVNNTIWTSGTVSGNTGFTNLDGSETNVTIKDNTIFATSAASGVGAAVSLVGSNHSVIGNLINVTNAATNSNNRGVYLNGGDYNLIFNNTMIVGGCCSNNYGVYLSNTANYNNVTRNNISTSGTSSNHGMLFDTSSSYNTASNNTIATSGSSSGNMGIRVSSGASNTIASNNISTSGTSGNYGIYIGDSSNNVTLNTVFASGTSSSNFGIYVLSSNSNAVQQNRISTYGTVSNEGIYLSAAYYNSIISNSISTGGTLTGNIGLELSDADYSTVSLNSISTSGSSGNYGIQLNSASNSSVLTRNNVTTNTSQSYGIYIHTSGNNTFRESIVNATAAEDIFLAGTTAGMENYFFNVSFNRSEVNVSAPNVQTKLLIQHLLDVTVMNQLGSNVSGAAVVGNDTSSVANYDNPTSNFSATTNSSGHIPTQTLTEFMANGTYNSTSGYLYFSNYDITVSKSSYFPQSSSINMTSYQNLSVTLEQLLSTIEVTARSLYSSTGSQVTSGTVTVTILETGESESATISGPQWSIPIYSRTDLNNTRFTLGVFVNDTSGKSGYFVSKVFGASTLPTQTTCTQQRWRLTGAAIDPTTGSLPSSGTVRVSVEGTQTTNSTTFSNGAWEIYVEPCLVSGSVHTFNVLLSDASGKSGTIVLRNVAK